MASTIGTAYLQIAPSTKGFSSALSGSVAPAGQEAGKKAGGLFGGAFTKIAGVLAAAGIADQFKKAIDTNKEFEASMSQVAATMGLTNEQFNNLTVTTEGFTGSLADFAKQMGATTAFSAKEAGDALNYMALAGYDAQTSAEMLPKVLNLAAAGNMDLARASDMVTDSQSALGLTLDETGVMVDQMARTASRSNTSVEQLGEAMLKIGATARNVKGGTAELSTILGVLADNGIKGTEGGTHLRNMLLSLQKASKDGVASFGDFNVAIYDTDGNMRSMVDIIADMQEGMEGMSQEAKDAMLSGVFNKTDLASINALLGTSQDRFAELSEEIAGAWYNSDSLYQTFRDLGQPLGIMEANLGKLGVTSEEFSAALNNSQGDANAFAKALLEAAGDGATMDDVIQAMGGSLGMIESAFSQAQGAAEAMAETQLDNLAGDITLFKSALEGARIELGGAFAPALRKVVQTGTDLLSNFATTMREQGPLAAVKELVKGIGDIGQHMLEEGLIFLRNFSDGVAQGLPELVEKGAVLLDNFVDSFMMNHERFLNVGLSLIQNLAQGIVNSIPKIADAAIKIVGKLIDYIFEQFPKIVQTGISLLSSLFEGWSKLYPKIVELVKTVTSKIWDNIKKVDWLSLGKQLLQAILNGIKLVASTLWDTVKSIFSTASEKAKGIDWQEVGKFVIRTIIKGLQLLFFDIPNKLKEIAGKAWDAVKEVDWIQLGIDIINAIIGGIKSLANGFKEFIKGLFTGAKESSSETVKKDFKDLGGEVPPAIKDGVKSNQNQVKTAIKDTLKPADDVVNSSDWEEVGAFIAKGIRKGINDNATLVANAAKSVTTNALKKTKAENQIYSPSRLWADEVGAYISEGIALGIDNEAGAVSDSLGYVADLADGMGGRVMRAASRNVSGVPVTAGTDDGVGVIIALLSRYLPECAEGMNGNNLLNAVNRRLGMAVI